MNKTMQDVYRKKEITGAIAILQADGVSDEVIISKVMDCFHVTREYVLALLAPQNA